MNRRGALIGFVVVIAALAGGYWMGAHRRTTSAQTASVPQAPSQAASAPPADGTQSVQLTPDEEKSIALTTVEVTPRELSSQIVTVGKVDEAETRLATISARVGGRIEKLHVTFTGQPVARGQAIADIYSPELLTAAQEYRLALDNRKHLGAASPEVRAQADELIAASRKRLELWGLTSAQIEKLAADPASGARIATYATASGVVTERKVTEGQYVEAGSALYTVADLSTVWAKLDVYEADLKLIRVGDPVVLTCDAVAGQLRGRVDFIDTTVNHDTRTASLRVQVPNPGMRLRPGMYVRATISAAPQRALAIPRASVIDTGTRNLVYVARGNGVYESREIKAGPAVGDLVPVFAGLTRGERVVKEGTFLVDSQTRITGGMTSAFGGAKGFSPESQTAAPEVKVELSVSPDPPKGDARIQYTVRLLDSSGKPISDAQVHVGIYMPPMPSMGMGEMKTGEDLAWNGSAYTATGNMPMQGSWAATVTATRNGQTIATYQTRLNAR